MNDEAGGAAGGESLYQNLVELSQGSTHGAGGGGGAPPLPRRK